MWVWTLNWNEIRSDLVIGSCPLEVTDIERIHDQAGATALLSLQSDVCLGHFGIDYAVHRLHGENLGLEMRRAPMRDFDIPDQRRHLVRAVRTLHDLLSHRHRVYLHCTAGLGRSALTALGYLTCVEAYGLDEALEVLRSRRSGIVPSLEAYWGCRGDLVDRHRAEIEHQAALAYRQRLSAHAEGSAASDWEAAERDILRKLLTAPPTRLSESV